MIAREVQFGKSSNKHHLVTATQLNDIALLA